MARADIDPIDIPNLLPHIGLIEVIDERTFRYRLRTHLNRVFGDDFTGDHLDAVKSGPYMEFLRSLYGDCSRDGAPLFNRALFGYVKSEDLIVNRLLLPLRDTADGPVTMLLFSNTFDLYERRFRRGTVRMWLSPGRSSSTTSAQSPCCSKRR